MVYVSVNGQFTNFSVRMGVVWFHAPQTCGSQPTVLVQASTSNSLTTNKNC